MTDETFYDLDVSKSGDQFTYLVINDDIIANVSNNVTINNCSLRLFDNSTLNVGEDLIIYDDTNLYANDSAPTTINITGNWFNYNSSGYPWGFGFIPGLSTVTFSGVNDTFIEADSGTEEFYNLKIDKPEGLFMPIDHVKVYNNAEIVQGSWYKDTSGLQFSFYGDLTIQADGSWDDDVNSVYFVGDEDQWLQNHGTGGTNIQHLYINQQTGSRTDPVVALNNNVSCYTLDVLEGGLFLNSQTLTCEHRIEINDGGRILGYSVSTIAMENNSELLIDGGELQLLGDGTNNPLVTHTTGNYEFNVINNGKVAADNVTFEYMDTDGINFYNGGLVDETNSMDDCTFQNGETGGSLIKINNSQYLTITNAHFPENTWGSTYNVSKVFQLGDIIFNQATGNFSGEDFDYDPNNVVTWIGPPEIVINPTYPLNFGEVEIGDSEVIGFSIENIGEGTLEGTITTPGGFFVVEHTRIDSSVDNSRNTISYSVESGITKTFLITFAPLLELTYEGDVVITHNAVGADETVHVIGVGIAPPPPEIFVDPVLLVFGDLLVGQKDSLSFYIENTGGSKLSGSITTPEGYTVSKLVVRDDFSNGSKSQIIPNPHHRNVIPFDIDEGEMTYYNVVFEPTVRQSYNGNIVITHNAGADEYVALEGNGIGAELTANPLSFEESLLENSTTSDVLALGNAGNLDLNYVASIVYLPPTRNVLVASGFEDTVPPTGWTTQLMNGYYNWMQDSHSHSGSSSAYTNPMYTDDARLITPSFTATADCSLTYWIRAYDPEQFVELAEFQIEVSTDGVGWTTIDSLSQSILTETYEQKILALGAYAGQDIQVSFSVFDNYTGSGVNIDDVVISGNSGPAYTWLTLDGGTSASGTIMVGNPDDDIIVGFDSSGLADSTYTANIVISSNDPVNPTVNVPVTLIVGAPLTAPENLTIEISGTNVILNWDAVTGADSYKVYSSDDPYETFENWILEQENITETTWDEPVPETKRFYYVTAVN